MPLSNAEIIDRELAAAAVEKRRTGRKPSAKELGALRRLEQKKRAEIGWEFVRNLSKKDYAAIAGTQQKVLNEQAIGFGMPIGGPSVDLTAVVGWMHNFLAKNKFKLKALDDEDAGCLEGASQKLKDEYLRQKIRVTKEQAIMARLERKKEESLFLHKSLVHETHGTIAGILRAAGEKLERKYGREARTMLDEALVNAQRHIDSSFGGDGSSTDANPA